MRAQFERLWERIRGAEQRYGRPSGCVSLLAVTKSFGPQVIAAAAGLGQRAFGENYVQEAIAKMAALGAQGELADLQWHFIGPMQSNKTRLIAGHFQWVQSIDRLAIAQRLSAQRPAELPPLQVLLEVNIGGEQSKSGIAPADLASLALEVAALPQLQLRGLMAIPQANLPEAGQRAAFARMRALLESLRQRMETRREIGQEAGRAPADTIAPPTPAGNAAASRPPVSLLDTLSMGMSADFEAAIAEGSTMVRVGSALFGERR